MSKVLVGWSGGCDSTLLLYHAARIYGTPQAPVRALSIVSDQISARDKETAARKKILKELRKRGLHIQHEIMRLEYEGNGIGHHGLPQAIMWLIGSQYLREKEALALGYIKGDDWVNYGHQITSVFDTLQRIGDRTGHLWTPLIHTEKRGVIQQLKELKLLKLTWWCECIYESKKKSCGQCISCQNHETAVWKLEKFGPPPYAWTGDE